MGKHQKKIENIYYDKYLKKHTIQERIKSKLREIEKKMDKLDIGLGKLKDVDKLGKRLASDMKTLGQEKWNDLSLEMIMKKSGRKFCKNNIKIKWTISPKMGLCPLLQRKSISECPKCQL